MSVMFLGNGVAILLLFQGAVVGLLDEICSGTPLSKNYTYLDAA
jgi:hypothetical protein